MSGARSRFRDRALIMLAASCLSAGLVKSDALVNLELFGQDQLHHLAPSLHFDRVAFVAIDDTSLGVLGRWPWSRRTHAAIVDRLAELGPARIGINIVFAEPDRMDAAGDAQLKGSIARAGNVVLATLPDGEPSHGRAVDVPPFHALAEVASALGSGQIRPDADGRTRAISPESLGRVITGPAGAEIGRSRSMSAVLPPVPSLNGLTVISAVDLLDEAVDRSAVAARFVIVGENAEGLSSKVWMAHGDDPQLVPGSIVQLASAAAISEDKVLWLPRATTATATLMTIGGLLPLLLPLPLAAVTLLSIAIIATAAFVAVAAMQVLLPFMIPLLVIATTFGSLSMISAWRHYRHSARTERRARRALDAISDAVLTTRNDDRVDYANFAATDLFSESGDSLIGADLHKLLPERNIRDGSDLVIADGAGRRRIYRARQRDIGKNRQKGTLIALTDVTADRRLVEEAKRRATSDPLTGLPNRLGMEQFLDGIILRSQAIEEGAAVVVVDLDRFKAINDALGRLAGDRVVCILCDRFCELAGSTEIVGRTGGNELTLIFPGLRTRDEVDQRLAVYRESLSKPVSVAAELLYLRASVGVALYPGDGDSADELLGSADAALQRAKEIGGNDVLYHERSSSGRGSGRSALWLERELRSALQSDQLEIHYQPRFGLDNRRITGLEALVRWRHPVRGLVPPAAFISFAEETGLICELGRIVLAKACLELSRRSDASSSLRLSINTSVVQLRCDPDFVSFVSDVLERMELAPGRLEVEVTESLFLDPALAQVGQQLEKLAALGVQLSIDDFGTGYSSLAYLHRFPFSRIKIDRSFVQRVDEDPSSLAIVSAIVGLGRSLAKSTTAEGVEEERQLHLLAELGCEEVQGFLLGRPQPLSGFASLS